MKFQFDHDHYEPNESNKTSEKSERKYSASEVKYSTAHGAIPKRSEYSRKYSSKYIYTESPSYMKREQPDDIIDIEKETHDSSES